MRANKSVFICADLWPIPNGVSRNLSIHESLMHFASYYRWQVYQELFGCPQPVATLLDVGCDDGGFVERLPARTSVAVDRDRLALRRARASARVCADGTRLPFHTVAFDVVVLSDVIEHVVADDQLVASVARHLRPGGTLWLSTTAAEFALFPAAITRRAERAWGHMRKGYRPADLLAILGDGFAVELVEWPEIMFRHAYLLMWAAAKRSPALARRVADLCFQADRRLRGSQRERGHIYIRAIRQ